MLFIRTIIAAAEERRLDGAGLLVAARVDARATRLAAAGQGADAGERGVLGRLHGEGLAHDGAAMGVDLQLGHGAAAGRGGLGTGRRGHGAERRGRGGLEEGAHGLGLTENAVHGYWLQRGMVIR